jgi:hypothetical protein
MSCCGHNSTPSKAAKSQRPALVKGKTRWPMWAKAIAALRAEGDAGVGDTVYRLIGPVTSEKFQRWHRLAFGRECGCPERRAEWNVRYPYVAELQD